MANKKLQRSISPSEIFYSSTISSSSSTFSSSMSSFSSPTRSTSPNRITIRHVVASTPSVRFSIDRRNDSATSTSHNKPNQNVNKSISNNNCNKLWSNGAKKTCMCSPTTHPGSFRCKLHRNGTQSHNNKDTTASYHSHRLYARRSAMTNSLVRIGTVEGDLMKRALSALIRPSSHQQRRRSDFQPKPSRLSVMSKTDD
ncbi:uncharacterized protein [Rutidosis leptorrhynchoides]|uniref:uncharacterized protein n=1 Tax=Rutidosis leptorrhynchoides TaxID=125765 RepID=UPI003A9A52EA